MALIKGIPKVNKALDEASKGYRGAVLAAVYQKGFAIIADSVKRTPVKTGRLRQSVFVGRPDRRGIVPIGYGTDYALAVHERVEVFHKIGGPKFLESAVNKHRNGYVDAINNLAKRNFQRGITAKAVPALWPERTGA